MKIDLILECYGSVRVAEHEWRDGTRFRTVAVEVPDWVGKHLEPRAAAEFVRVVGATEHQAR